MHGLLTRTTSVFSSVKWTCSDRGQGGVLGWEGGSTQPRGVLSCLWEALRYLGDHPAELLELLQAPGRVQVWVWSQQHVACEHGLPGVQQTAGSPRQLLEPASGGVESSPGMMHV